LSRLLLVEKNSFIRDSLCPLLQARFPSLIIKAVINYDDCLTSMEKFKPDILILGIADNGDIGLKNLQQVRAQFPTTVIVLFTSYEMEEYRKQAIMKGANHIISKELWTGHEILALMRTILATKDCWDGEYTEGILVDKDTLVRPLERRNKDNRGRAREKEYLAGKPDRRQ